MNKLLIIDTDMGNDDIMAIALLLLYPKIEILGFTTIFGVTNASRGSINLQRILRYCKKNIPVVTGSSASLKNNEISFPSRDIRRAEELVLLNNLHVPKIRVSPNEMAAEEFLLQSSKRTGLTILALGPLTNIANTINKYGKEFTNNVKEIILMGGGVARGNVPPLYIAEFNILLDPEAADIVFTSDIQITMVGIDATVKVPVSQDFEYSVGSLGATNPMQKLIKEIIINNDNDLDAYYDALAALTLCYPSIINKRIKGVIRISLSGADRGRTIYVATKNGNCTIAMDANTSSFYQLIRTTIGKNRL